MYCRSNFSNFSGQISDVNIWNKSLNKEELSSFIVDCKNQNNQTNSPNILDWSQASQTIQNVNIPISKVARDTFCKGPLEAREQIFIFPLELSMDDSYSLCENLGGHFPIPRSGQQYQNIFAKTFPKGKFSTIN